MPSKIEYVDETWNVVTGCTKISPGCTNCFAERMARRLAGRFGYPEAPRHFDVTLHPDKLDEPLRRKKPTRYLTCSMGDLFHPDMTEDFVNEGFLADVFNMMQTCNNHTFLVLTKRPKRMAEFMESWLYPYRHPSLPPVGEKGSLSIQQVLPNVWLGVTVETQDEMWRVEELLKIPAAKHWVSIEPMLGPIEIPKRMLNPYPEHISQGFDPHTGKRRVWNKPRPRLDWVVLGGETGPGARPCHPDWVRKVRDDCVAAAVDFYFKNWGGWHPAVWLTQDGDIAAIKAEYDNSEDVFGDGEYMLPVPHGRKSGRVLDGRTWDEMPED